MPSAEDQGESLDPEAPVLFSLILSSSGSHQADNAPQCDQIRPACSSCGRKGQICHYSEETEQNNPNNPVIRHHIRARTVTVVSTTEPGQRTVLPVPEFAESSNRAESSLESRRTRSLSGSEERLARMDKRERIATGFDSESESEMVKIEPREREREVEDESREKESVGSGSRRRDERQDDGVSGEVRKS